MYSLFDRLLLVVAGVITVVLFAIFVVTIGALAGTDWAFAVVDKVKDLL